MSRTAAVAATAAGVGMGDRLVRNIRDLQLDDELDFPDIDASTFDSKDSVHNQAHRIRKAEWVLYQLFQLWSPAGAKSLAEFFPACDPKQSSDLRNAIFHQLNALKKDGVLPKEIVLRKTMFDECKGPKFEELLVAFSTSVLLKVLDEDAADRSVVKRILLSEKPVDASQLQVWETAYRSSLSNLVNERQNLKRRWQRFGRVLKVKEDEIKQRRREHEIKVEDAKLSRIPRRRLDRLQSHMERDWVTSSEWRSILTKGDQHLPDKSLLERPYDEVWHHASEDSLYHFRPDKARSSLQRLEYHVDKQNQRVAKWREAKRLLDQVVSEPSNETRTNGVPARSGSPELGTTTYEQTNVNRRQVNREITPPRPSTAKRRSVGHNSPLSLVTENVGQLSIQARRSPDPSNLLSTPNKLSQPLSSASEKANRRRSNTVIFSPQPSLGSKSSMDRLDGGYESPTGYFDDSLEVGEDVTNIVNSVLQPEPSPIKPSRPLSLTERARMSMAAQTAGPRLYDRARSTSPVKQSSPYPEGHSTSMALDERTRQSMLFLSNAMAPPPAPSPDSPPRPGTSRRVNVTKRSSRSPEKRHRLPRTDTPELTHVDESFLTENIDEDTIFMSRPKIAHSPPLHPVSGRSQDISGLEFIDTESVEDFS